MQGEIDKEFENIDRKQYMLHKNLNINKKNINIKKSLLNDLGEMDINNYEKQTDHSSQQTPQQIQPK